MAADFLQSNLFTPSAPSERYLKEARRRKLRVEECDPRRQGRKATHSRRPNTGYDLQCNNNNHAIRNHNVRPYSAVQKNVQSSDATTTVSSTGWRGKSDRAMKSHITAPMLSSILNSGLVKIPGPPENPRQIRPVVSNSSLSSRRERVRRSVSQNLPLQGNTFTSKREVLLQDTDSKGQCVLTCSGSQSKDTNIEEISETIVNFLVVDTLTVSTNTICTTKTCSSIDANSLDHVGVQENKEFDQPEQDDRILLVETKEQNVILKGDEFSSLNKGRSGNTSEGQCPKSSEEKHGADLACDTADVLQIQKDFHNINLTQGKNIKTLLTNRFAQNKINHNSFRESLNESSTILPSGKSAREIPKTSHLEGNMTDCNGIPNERKKLLHLFHLFFRLRWNGSAKKEDKMFLIDDGNEEFDSHPQDLPPDENRRKKKAKQKQFLAAQRLSALLNKWLHDKNKEAKLAEAKPDTKKKRRFRKKNVSRAGRRIKKRLGYGCRYIGYGLVNMTSIIPEASYINPLGYDSTQDYYYDDDGLAWDPVKQPYIKTPYSC